MKSTRVSILLIGAALALSSSAFAGGANKGTLQLSDKVNVEGKPLNPGTYTVEWDGSGPAVQVTLRHGKDTVATFPAHLTEQATPNPANAYGSDKQADGSTSLTAIYLGGKRFVLEVEQTEAGKQTSNSESK